jgi:hypothetical protein
VEEYAAQGNRANASLDVDLQRRLESGPAEAIDVAHFERLRGEGKQATAGAFTLTNPEVFVPRRPSTPAYFLARYTVKAGNVPPIRQLAVFAQESATAPWKVDVFVNLVPDGLVAGGRLPEVAVDGGYTDSVSAGEDAGWKFSPAALGPYLASFLNGDSSSNVFASGPVTSQLVRTQKHNAEKATASKLRLTYSFGPSDYPSYSFRTRDKGALTLFTLELEERVVADDGAPALRQDASRTTFGGLLPPGEYQEVRTQYLIPVAAHVPPRGSDQLATIVGLYQGVVQVSGTPPPQ